jgi:HEAT repeat protein
VAQAGPAELVKLVARGDLRTRFFAARRLGEHRRTEAVKALLGRVTDPDEDWLVRKDAVLALGRLRAVKAVDELGKLLKTQKPDLKYFATQALAEISKAVTPTELEPEGDDLKLELDAAP